MAKPAVFRGKKPGINYPKRRGRFRSNFELSISKQLIEKGCHWKYEHTKYEYYVPLIGTVICKNCGPTKVIQRKHYLPDFFLSNGVIIEGKGRLVAADRKKLEAIRKYHPNLDLRILFQYDRKFSKHSERRYSDWAESIGLPWAVGKIPDEWMLHADQPWPRNVDSLFKHNKDLVEIPKIVRKKRKDAKTP